MAKYILANTVTVGNQLYRVARELDDQFDDVSGIRSVGGVVIGLPNQFAERYAGFIRQAQSTGQTDWEAYASSLLLSVQTTVRPSIEWRAVGDEHGESFSHAHEWSTVERFIADNQGNCDVFVHGTVADSFVIPATADVQGNCALNFMLSEQNIAGNGPVITIEDGAKLRNVRQVFCSFQGVFTTQRPFVQDRAGASLQFRDGGGIYALPGSTVGCVHGVAAGTQAVSYFAGAIVCQEPLVPAVYVDPDIFFIFATIQQLGSSGLAPNQLGGAGTATCYYLADASQPLADQPLFLGTLQLQRQTFQEALNPSAYTTATRPTFQLVPGVQVFDTDLGIPIWWNGTAWVDATGTVV